MNNAEFVLLMVVGSLLALFLLLLVVAAIIGVMLLKKAKKIGDRADNVAQSMESAASSVESAFWNIGRVTSPLAIFKLLAAIAKNGAKTSKRR